MVKSGYKLDRDEQGFTVLQREVIELTAQGLNGNQVAAKLGVVRQRVSTMKKEIAAIEARNAEEKANG